MTLLHACLWRGVFLCPEEENNIPDTVSNPSFLRLVRAANFSSVVTDDLSQR